MINKKFFFFFDLAHFCVCQKKKQMSNKWFNFRYDDSEAPVLTRQPYSRRLKFYISVLVLTFVALYIVFHHFGHPQNS